MQCSTNPVIVVGGGIAGVTCAKVLSMDNPQLQIILISASPIVKVISNLKTIGRSIDIFNVIEQHSNSLQTNNLKVIINQVVKLNAAKHQIRLNNGETLNYSRLCICTGAKPKIIPVNNVEATKFIKCIRDTQTAKDFQSILSDSKRIVIVGNGGIASELAYEVSNCEIIWAIKDKTFGATFFDAAVAKFFAEHLHESHNKEEAILKRHRFDTTGSDRYENEFGVALGPDWHSGMELVGQSQKKITIENHCEVLKVYSRLDTISVDKRIHNKLDDKYNIYVELNNGHIYGCDMLISATGVCPNASVFTYDNAFKLGADGGLLVDNEMRTSVDLVYACGDVCTAGWEIAPNWFQMRLWTQARQMGFYAAKCIQSHIENTSPSLFFNFDVFAHVTRFFGFRVILLGLYNGQKLASNDYKILYKVIPRKTFIKAIIQDNKMRGAILIGETEFEETFENLIYSGLDLAHFGPHLLDDMLDVEDYFD